MSEAIFGVIGTIIGTIIGAILGFRLSERATRQREERTEKRQAGAIRTLLRLEIDQNLALLRDFWSEVNQVDESEEDPDLARLRLARRMVGLPVPHWCHTMWKSQTPLLVVALSEEEIKQVHNLHIGLDAIAAIHSKLSALESEQREELRAARNETGMVPMSKAMGLSQSFNRNAPGLWMECERIVREVLDKGNPLRDQTRNGR
jgi:hypothetical protein